MDSALETRGPHTPVTEYATAPLPKVSSVRARAAFFDAAFGLKASLYKPDEDDAYNPDDSGCHASAGGVSTCSCSASESHSSSDGPGCAQHGFASSLGDAMQPFGTPRPRGTAASFVPTLDPTLPVFLEEPLPRAVAKSQRPSCVARVLRCLTEYNNAQVCIGTDADHHHHHAGVHCDIARGNPLAGTVIGVPVEPAVARGAAVPEVSYVTEEYVSEEWHPFEGDVEADHLDETKPEIWGLVEAISDVQADDESEEQEYAEPELDEAQEDVQDTDAEESEGEAYLGGEDDFLDEEEESYVAEEDAADQESSAEDSEAAGDEVDLTEEEDTTSSDAVGEYTVATRGLEEDSWCCSSSSTSAGSAAACGGESMRLAPAAHSRQKYVDPSRPARIAHTPGTRGSAWITLPIGDGAHRHRIRFT